MRLNFLSKNNWLTVCVCLLAVFGFMPGGANAAEIVGLRFGATSSNETRLVIDAIGAPDYDFEVAPNGRDFSVRLSTTKLTAVVPKAGKGGGHVESYAATDNRNGSVVVSYTLRSTARLKEAFVIPADSANPKTRVVIDLVSAPPGRMAASLPARKFENMTDVIAAVSPPPATSVTPPSIQTHPLAEAPPPPVAKPVIVIDAGHGGTDPGAAGPDGARESDVTLAAALTLAEILNATGRYEVVLTRTKDVRLAHEERSRIAREAKAGLFISLHADAHSESKVRGGSVYTLSDEGTERSAREALAQGNYVVHDLDITEPGREVGGILYNLAQRDTANASDKFAELLISKLVGVTPLLNNTHRRGNFKVLLAPDVPAVLLELAFISNRLDEKNLQSAAWRKRSMGATAGAIDAYFQQRGSEKHASNTRPPASR